MYVCLRERDRGRETYRQTSERERRREKWTVEGGRGLWRDFRYPPYQAVANLYSML